METLVKVPVKTPIDWKFSEETLVKTPMETPVDLPHKGVKLGDNLDDLIQMDLHHEG